MKNLTVFITVLFALTASAFADTSVQSSYSSVSTYATGHVPLTPLKRGNGSNEQVIAESAPPQDYTRVLYAGPNKERIALLEERLNPKPAAAPVNQTVNNVNVNVAQPDGVHVGSVVSDQ